MQTNVCPRILDEVVLALTSNLGGCNIFKEIDFKPSFKKTTLHINVIIQRDYFLKEIVDI